MANKNLINAEAAIPADVTIYTKGGLGIVRTIKEGTELLFCLKDICTLLEVKNSVDVKTSISNEYGESAALTYPIKDLLGRLQQATFITERALIFVLMRSDKPKAKAARKWFMDELIPSLKEVKVEAPVVEVIDNTKKNNLPVFHFADYELDYALLDGEPLFNLNSVAEFLGIVNPHTSIDTKDEDYVVKIASSILGLTYNRTIHNTGELFLTEAGLYKLIMASKKPSAEKFQKWVVKEVLPSIRKTGSYGLPGTYLEALKNLVASEEQRLAQAKEIEALNNKITQDAPKVEFADAVSSSKDSINLGQLAIILKQNGVDIGRNKLFKYLRENGYLVNQRGKEHNRPTQKAMDLGLFEVQERVVVINNESCIKFTAMVTPKGQQYFIDLFLKQAV